MIKVNYSTLKVSGYEWTQEFDDVKVMEKAVLKYIESKKKDMRGTQAGWSYLPFIYKRQTLATTHIIKTWR